MKHLSFKSFTRFISLVFAAAVLLPAISFSSPKGNNLVFQSNPNQTQVNITIAATVPQFKNGKLTGGWDPRRIIVYQGQKVNLSIKAMDVQHIFDLPAYGIKVPLTPGQTEHVSFTANKTGIFFFHCANQECAPEALHRLMVGQVIVKDESDSK
jgi:heme/copper-type cytochrome/quinol oxidase subunit 2